MTVVNLPVLVVETGPGSPGWKRIMKEISDNVGNGFSCAINTSGKAVMKRMLDSDVLWGNPKMHTDYNHATGAGEIKVTYGNLRYYFAIKAGDPAVENIIRPFDTGNHKELKHTVIVLDLNRADKIEEATKQVNGYFRPNPESPRNTADKKTSNKLHARRKRTLDLITNEIAADA